MSAGGDEGSNKLLGPRPTPAAALCHGPHSLSSERSHRGKSSEGVGMEQGPLSHYRKCLLTVFVRKVELACILGSTTRFLCTENPS